MKNKNIKLFIKVMLSLILISAGITCYMAYNAEEHIIECKTDNFYYIYGVIDEETCILFKRTEKMTETELKALKEYEDSNGELEGLVMVDTHVSEEAKQNYMPSSENIDVYGMQNTYVCEKGIGPFRHRFEKVMDVLYLTDNTAIKLGVKEGELNYEYITDSTGSDESGNVGIATDSTIGGIKDEKE